MEKYTKEFKEFMNKHKDTEIEEGYNIKLRGFVDREMVLGVMFWDTLYPTYKDKMIWASGLSN